MSCNEQHLSGLTRSLLLSAAVGAVPLLVVGCAPWMVGGQTAAVSTGATTTITPASEETLCAQLLRRQTARDAEVLMRAYPDANCIPAALAALPPSVLAVIAPSAVRGLSDRIRAQIPPQTMRHLRLVTAAPTRSEGGGSGPY